MHWQQERRRKRICTVTGCTKGQLARGLCAAHYRRWQRYGDPLGGGTMRGYVRRFIEEAVNYDGTECLLWPYSVNRQGYGQLGYDGDTYRAHNLICRLVHGDPIGASQAAAHTCGNKLCVAPNHLRWATRKENSSDSRLHGTHRSKLTEANVITIRSRPEVSIRKLAKELGVSETTIRGVRDRRTWTWVKEFDVEEAA